ncbi:MAG: hypothetical protein DME50_09150, partial [Verrucomicrobia bacterium]
MMLKETRRGMKKTLRRGAAKSVRGASAPQQESSVLYKVRDRYVEALRWCLAHRGIVFAAMGGFVLISLCLVPFLGRDFFPAVDAGQFRLHVRAPAGTRIEATEERFYEVGRVIREVIP